MLLEVVLLMTYLRLSWHQGIMYWRICSAARGESLFRWRGRGVAFQCTGITLTVRLEPVHMNIISTTTTSATTAHTLITT